MLLENERKLIVEFGKKLITNGLTKGTGGNLSIYNRTEKLMAIKPTGIEYFDIKPEDVVIMDMNGKIVDGDKKPSSEFSMHKILYEKRDDVNAVIHTHSTYTTTLSCLHWDLPAVHYLVALAGQDVRCAEYATYGTPELAQNAWKAMEGRNAVLLANHGLLVGAGNIGQCFGTLEEIEFCAELYWRTKCAGEPVILSEKEMKIVAEKFKTYGQQKK